MPHIFYSCYAHKNREGEQFIPQHIFSHLLAGSSEIILGGKPFTFKEGEYRFFRRNQLSRYTKLPPPGGQYRSISISIDQATLHSISEEHDLHMRQLYAQDTALLLQPNQLFSNYIHSLTPYLDGATESQNGPNHGARVGTNVGANVINQALTNLKVREAVMILLRTNPILQDILFDFSEPGKIDLEAYMNEHYKFNVDVDRFAYLTGRSLATFKRDFEKIFHTSPNRWLQQKRLADAWYLIKEKGWKTTDVYLEVGFKDLSHFSFAFKKAFGIAPSSLSPT